MGVGVVRDPSVDCSVGGRVPNGVSRVCVCVCVCVCVYDEVGNDEIEKEGELISMVWVITEKESEEGTVTSLPTGGQNRPTGLCIATDRV